MSILEKQMQDNEPQLILSLKNGSYKAFERIYQMYAKRLFAYSLQFTKSQEESEEIVQVSDKASIRRSARRQTVRQI